MHLLSRVLHKHLPDCPQQVKFRFRACKHFERTVAQIEQAKSVLWTFFIRLSIQTTLFLWVANKHVIQAIVVVLFCFFVYFTCPSGQVVIKTYLAPCWDICKIVFSLMQMITRQSYHQHSTPDMIAFYCQS